MTASRVHPGGVATTSSNVAGLVAPLLQSLVGSLTARIEFWDQSAIGPDDSVNRLIIRSPDALRRLVWAPGELGAGRAFVAGDIDFEGDIIELIVLLRPVGVRLRRALATLPATLKAANELGVLSGPIPPPKEEARPRGWRHSKKRDAEAISHHYDVGNEFYRLVLGASMTYSCARFSRRDLSLEAAQDAKHELVCRKLGLHERPGMRLLDVGCGWGSMAIHAARHHGATAVGITISQEQADEARKRVAAAGLTDQVEIRLQDYRDINGGSRKMSGRAGREVNGERFDAISSIGMFEHVGRERMAQYFSVLRGALVPGGRLLNHAISSVGGSKLRSRSFIGRYVFPDGELIDVGQVALAMEAGGFEVRDVESLREHYAETLRRWVANLQAQWDTAVDLVGEARARVWLLYMAACSVGFDDGGLSVHQVLGVVPDDDGNSFMPLTRDDWS